MEEGIFTGPLEDPVEMYSGLKIVNRTMSAEQVTQKIGKSRVIPLTSIEYEFSQPRTTDFVVIAALSEVSGVKTASFNSQKYKELIFTDLSFPSCGTWSVLIFDAAFAHFKGEVGQIWAILNPQLMPFKPTKFSSQSEEKKPLKVTRIQQFLCLGEAPNLGHCGFQTTQQKRPCPNPIDRSQMKICFFHNQLQSSFRQEPSGRYVPTTRMRLMGQGSQRNMDGSAVMADHNLLKKVKAKTLHTHGSQPGAFRDALPTSARNRERLPLFMDLKKPAAPSAAQLKRREQNERHQLAMNLENRRLAQKTDRGDYMKNAMKSRDFAASTNVPVLGRAAGEEVDLGDPDDLPENPRMNLKAAPQKRPLFEKAPEEPPAKLRFTPQKLPMFLETLEGLKTCPADNVGRLSTLLGHLEKCPDMTTDLIKTHGVEAFLTTLEDHKCGPRVTTLVRNVTRKIRRLERLEFEVQQEAAELMDQQPVAPFVCDLGRRKVHEDLTLQRCRERVPGRVQDVGKVSHTRAEPTGPPIEETPLGPRLTTEEMRAKMTDGLESARLNRTLAEEEPSPP